jgi:hypothetical protein
MLGNDIFSYTVSNGYTFYMEILVVTVIFNSIEVTKIFKK